jgi:hypothetical protein
MGEIEVTNALHDKDLLDASCFGSFTHMKGEAK